MSIQNKLLLIFISFLIVPLTVIGSILLIVTSDIAEQSFLARQNSRLVSRRALLVSQMNSWASVFKLLRDSAEIHQQYDVPAGTGIQVPQIEDAIQVIKQTMRLYPGLMQVRLLTTGGREELGVKRLNDTLLVSPPDTLQDRSQSEYFQGLKNSTRNDLSFLIITTNQREGKIAPASPNTLLIGKAFFSADGERRGFLLLDFSVGSLFQELRRTDLGHIYIVDETGLYLSPPAASEPNSASHSLASDDPELFSSVLFDASGQRFSPDSDRYTAWQTVSYSPSDPARKLALISSVSRHEFLAPIRRTGIFFAVLLIGTLALLLLVARRSARAVTTPLHRMVEQARAIGTGTLSARVQPGGVSEFELLAREFNLMAANLESVMISRERLTSEVQIRKEMQTDLERSQTALLNILEDLKAQKTALQLSEARFQVAINSSPVAILMVNREGAITFSNEESERLFGYQRGELLGRQIEELVPECFAADPPALSKSFFASPSRRTLGDGTEICARHKSGTQFPVEIALNPVEIDNEVSVLSSIIDLTERIRTEHQLRFYNEEMEQLLYTVSHDLKAPLVTIHGFSGMVESALERGDKAEALDAAARVLRACKTMERTLSDLLRLNRLGKQESEITEFDPRKLFEDVISAVAAEIAGKNIQIVQEVTIDSIKGDRRRMEQALLNLLSNAIRYGCPEPNMTIWIGVQPAHQFIHFYVRDEGPGIDEKFHRSVFQLFQRLQRDTDGSGIGLAIVTKAARMLGGDAWLESEPGRGSIFWFSARKL